MSVMALPNVGVTPRPPLVPVSAEEWSLEYVTRLYVADQLDDGQYEDLVGWVLDGGDLRLVSARPPWPWHTR
jgi:hypothetical protein